MLSGCHISSSCVSFDSVVAAVILAVAAIDIDVAAAVAFAVDAAAIFLGVCH